MTHAEYLAMRSNIPERRFRELREGIIVLEREAQELCNEERQNLSVAYRVMNKASYDSGNDLGRITLTEIRDPKKLERISTYCIFD